MDSTKNDAALAGAREELVAEARGAAEKEIVRRVYKLEDIGKHRTWLDGRSRVLEDETRETFALAMSDHGASGAVAAELPLLAAAYRLTGEEGFRNRVVAQLEEMAGWSPLQRPGWTCYTPGNRLPADGKDGNWLATGCGVRAIAVTMDLMPPGSVGDELRGRLERLLEGEIAGVVDDWKTQRPWFVRGNNAVTNQWVLPTEGLVTACLVLGVDKHREAYELGVKNLLRALDAHGAAGEFEEGFGYASFTVTSMLHAAHAMAAADDLRAIDHPFLKNFPTWLVHHFQPGGMIVNCFDAGAAYGAAERARPLLALLAVCTESPVARWALAYALGDAPKAQMDVAGLAALALPRVGPEAAPALFASYERAARVNWRDSWQNDGSGVWVRGGHPLDQHDHQDRGHVNFIRHGRPILIEAGTPSYDHPLMMSQYTPGVGHNVLQLGTAFRDTPAVPGKLVWYPGWQKERGVAPITVRRLDGAGGDVVVDAARCYDGLSRWLREAAWDAERLTVTDDVGLAEGQPDVVLFRWHLGTETEVAIEGRDSRYSVTWPEAQLVIEASAPLDVSQRMMPDNTLAGRSGQENPKDVHTCVIVQTREKCQAVQMTMRVAPNP